MSSSFNSSTAVSDDRKPQHTVLLFSSYLRHFFFSVIDIVSFQELFFKMIIKVVSASSPSSASSASLSLLYK